MDQEGYPEESELQTIINWDLFDVFNLIEFITSRWNWQELGVKKYWDKKRGRPVLKLELHTGGWSGNESLIHALLANRMIGMWYESWRRGGHYYFEIVPFNIGYQTVSEFAKKMGISKQGIHKNKEKYEWLDIGNKLLLVRDKKVRPVLNSEQTVQASDTTEADSTTKVK